MRGLGDQRCFAPGAMVAPHVIFVERLQFCINGKDTRACGVDGECGNLPTGYARGGCSLPSGFRESAHVVVMTLRRMVGVVFFPMQRILGNA